MEEIEDLTLAIALAVVELKKMADHFRDEGESGAVHTVIGQATGMILALGMIGAIDGGKEDALGAARRPDMNYAKLRLAVASMVSGDENSTLGLLDEWDLDKSFHIFKAI
ncbi:hypothetical protein [Planotetraspora kaengkrachanensis]|uniref:Uncharacterized protein n=1 Tax=Planotetraspora kaengkrachanensis TaxID=575193 RepID=A0A8J3PT89_9ACTN|nr:hypothetical protein [Planotetraspora kaengkrachanensis]GIG80043.1 hypothetical protein Pka01_31700 [Planotetraspora kaengkrachanensis]